MVWYRRAADAGYTKASITLAFAVPLALGVEGDAAQAVVWFRRAADTGYTGAQL